MTEKLDVKLIKGKKIRTDNGKINEIISLWKEVPSLDLNGDIYAVYFNYESDFNGEYDFLIGSEINKLNDIVKIKEGNYMVWEVKNNSPEAVGEVWKEIWNSNIERSYDTDFELYNKNGTIKVYIGIL